MKGFLGFLLGTAALGTGLYFTMRGGGGGGSAAPALSGWRTKNRPRGLRGEAEANELQLFIDNDEQLYRGQTKSIQRNLATKLAKKVYDKTKAEKLWMYLVESGAKKYAKEFGSDFISDRPGVPWNKMFSMEDRRAVAKDMNDQFLEQWKNGEFDSVLPKKYQRA